MAVSASPSDPDRYFRYLYSCDIEQYVGVKLCTLEGSIPRLSYQDLLDDPVLKYSGRNQAKFPDLRVTAVITSGATGQQLHVPIGSSYKHFTIRFEWNEWLKLPVKLSELPRDALLCLTVWDSDGPGRQKAIGGTTLPLFGPRDAVYRQGQVDLRLWNDVEADGGGRERGGASSTPGLEEFGDDTGDNLQRLPRLYRDYQRGLIPKVEWLDQKALSLVTRHLQQDKAHANQLFLMVQFENFIIDGREHCVVYYEKGADAADDDDFTIGPDVIRCHDDDMFFDNPVEAKHHALSRSARAGQLERDLKPNADTRNRLSEIIAMPSTQVLTSSEQDLVWKYRYSLCSENKALMKFVKCINWKVKHEASQALDLIAKWTPISPQDALELLGPSFNHPSLRQYAVQRLRQASDGDLQLYLLQLVQALKYEKINQEWLRANLDTSKDNLMSMALDESTTGDSGDGAKGSANVSQTESDNGSTTLSTGPTTTATLSQNVANMTISSSSSVDGGLAGFLIDRACNNPSIANFLYWYLTVECEEPEGTAAAGILGEAKKVQEMYMLVMRRFKNQLKRGPPEWRENLAFLDRQRHFMEKLVQLIKAVQRENGNRQKKIERLQHLLRDPEAFKYNFVRFEPLRLPLDPDVQVCGLVPERANLFKSSLMPARLSFVTTSGGTYVTLFKNGDDLRQDQLILQIITLMDRILQQENLDLKLTPYKVLATSTKQGFVQFIDSHPIADVLASDGTIQNFFRKHNPLESAPYGIQPDVMDTYVKSCAGYCVITFILGVGDRHLDNLMLTHSGSLFHIDFGYILGRDPKVLPPPMKLSKEMIEAFGGVQSEFYQQFRKECYTAYLSLRRQANLILNLFSLMVNASVPDIALEPDKTVKKVEDKFKLDLTDEEAVKYMQEVIEISAMAVMPAIVDRMHKLTQFMKN